MKMNENLNIDEMLNSYLDGELPIRQRTEIQRMVSNDPQVALRLKQLQKCKLLVNSLPAVQAPAGLLENIKASLQKHQTRDEERVTIQSLPVVPRTLVFRRLAAVAAVLTMAAVLSAVFYSILPKSPALESTDGTVAVASDQGKFTGRLELKTSDISAVDSVINRVIEDYGLSAPAAANKSNRRVYTLACDRQQLDGVLSRLGDIWDQFDSAKLLVETGTFGREVAVDAVTVKQIAEITSSSNAAGLAGDFAMMNNIHDRFGPGRLGSDTEGIGEIMTIPQPVLTSNSHKNVKPASTSSESDKTIHLTIVLSR
jgi:hypothetical protein